MKKIVKIPLTLLLTFSLVSGCTVFSGIESPLPDEENQSVLNFHTALSADETDTVYLNKHTPVIDGSIDLEYYSSFHIEHYWPKSYYADQYWASGKFSFYKTDEKGFDIEGEDGNYIYKGYTDYKWDCKASSYYLWDDDNLYVAVKVIDDDYGCVSTDRLHYAITCENPLLCKQDSVILQLSFDTWKKDNKSQSISAERAGRAITSLFAIDGLNSFVELADPETENIFFDIHSGWAFEDNEDYFAVSETTNGYIIEMQLPIKGSDKTEIWKDGEKFNIQLGIMDSPENARYDIKQTLDDSEGPFHGEGGSFIDFISLYDPTPYQLSLSNNFEKNDINLDGKVNTKDLVRLMKYIANDSTVKPQDINGDGKLNSKDIVALMKDIAES